MKEEKKVRIFTIKIMWQDLGTVTSKQLAVTVLASLNVSVDDELLYRAMIFENIVV